MPALIRLLAVAMLTVSLAANPPTTAADCDGDDQVTGSLRLRGEATASVYAGSSASVSLWVEGPRGPRTSALSWDLACELPEGVSVEFLRGGSPSVTLLVVDVSCAAEPGWVPIRPRATTADGTAATTLWIEITPAPGDSVPEGVVWLSFTADSAFDWPGGTSSSGSVGALLSYHVCDAREPDYLEVTVTDIYAEDGRRLPPRRPEFVKSLIGSLGPGANLVPYPSNLRQNVVPLPAYPIEHPGGAWVYLRDGTYGIYVRGAGRMIEAYLQPSERPAWARIEITRGRGA